MPTKTISAEEIELIIDAFLSQYAYLSPSQSTYANLCNFSISNPYDDESFWEMLVPDLIEEIEGCSWDFYNLPTFNEMYFDSYKPDGAIFSEFNSFFDIYCEGRKNSDQKLEERFGKDLCEEFARIAESILTIGEDNKLFSWLADKAPASARARGVEFEKTKLRNWYRDQVNADNKQLEDVINVTEAVKLLATLDQ